MAETDSDARVPLAPRLVLLIIMMVGVALWIFGAERQGLWLDEFHSLQHARQADLGSFLSSVRDDNHPPLYFLFLRGARALFGESHLALRLPSLLASLGVLAILWLRGTARARIAAALFAVSSYALVIAVDARMYAQLALAVTGLWAAMEGARGPSSRLPKRSRVMAGLWCTVGLYTHYFFFYFAFVAVAVLLVDFLRRPEERARIARLAGAMALSLLLFLPWFWWGMRHQLGHGLAPGRSHTGWLDWPLSILHFFFIDVGAGGSVSLLATGLGLGACALLALGNLWWLRRSSAEERRHWCEVGALALLAPGLAFTVACLVERSGYNWKYVAGAAPLSLWLVVPDFAGDRRWLRAQRALLASLALCMIIVSAWSAFDRGREDYAGAIRELSRHDAKAELVFVSPAVFPDGARRLAPWRYYAEREDADPDRALSLDLLPETKLKRRAVAVLMRGELPSWVLHRLAPSHRQEISISFGKDLSLHRFHPRLD